MGGAPRAGGETSAQGGLLLPVVVLLAAIPRGASVQRPGAFKPVD